MDVTPSRTYGPLLSSSSLRAPSPVPRRAFSLPAMRSLLPSLSSTAQLLPLSLSRPGSPHAPGTRTAKRLSQTIRSRVSHNKVRLILGSLLLTAAFLWVNSHTRSHPVARRLRARTAQTVLAGNGLSVMDTDDTDEWLAEDDLFYSQYTEDTPLSPEAAAAEAEMASRKADVIEQNRQQSLRALAWWLAEGGELPEDWEVPSKAYLKKVGGRGFERMLEDIEDVELGDEAMFEEGWADFAKKRYRTVVFSKTFCPYSKRAKSILLSYNLSPAPFIVELDLRPDTAQLQDLLMHLTGRRTVPNILLDFVSMGGSDDLTLMHSEGGLRRKFKEMGMLPGRSYMYPPPRVNLPILPPVPGAVRPKPVQGEPLKPAGAFVGEAEQVVPPGTGDAFAPVLPDVSEPEASVDEDDEEEPLVGAEVPEAEESEEETVEDEDEDEDGDDETPLDPADIRKAIQAAHGDQYILDGDDDYKFYGVTEEYVAAQQAAALRADARELSDEVSEEELVGRVPAQAPAGGWAAVKAQKLAEAELARDKATREKAARERAEMEAEIKRTEEAAEARRVADAMKRADAAALVKPKGRRRKAKPKPKALDVDTLVRKADSPEVIPQPVVAAPIPQPSPIVAPAALHPQPIPAPAVPIPAGQEQFNEVLPPQKKADTAAARAEALRKKRAAVRAAKARAAGKGKKGVPAWEDKAVVKKAAGLPLVEKDVPAWQDKAVVKKAAAPPFVEKAALVGQKLRAQAALEAKAEAVKAKAAVKEAAGGVRKPEPKIRAGAKKAVVAKGQAGRRRGRVL